MTTFITIFLVLVGINVAMVLVNLFRVSQKSKKIVPKITSTTTTVIYPLDLATTGYQEAV